MSDFIAEDMNEQWGALVVANLSEEQKQHILNFVNWLDEHTTPIAAPTTEDGGKQDA